ncbi:MAG: hypothetical protein ACO24W_01970 [Candidatus Nanopelagicales bacterium]
MSLFRRPVAFLVALSDSKVKKDWVTLSKSVMVVVPGVFALSRGRIGKSSIAGLIAPGIALGKIVKEVNNQVTPEHENRADFLIEDTKIKVSTSVENLKERFKK